MARNEKADVTQLGSEGGGEVGCHSKMDIDNGKSKKEILHEVTCPVTGNFIAAGYS